MRRWYSSASCGLLLILCGGVSIAADQAQINEAIAKGSKYLVNYASQPGYNGGRHGLGSAALSGIAMLESNVPRDNPALLNITRLVRLAAPTSNKTYDIALAIVFLDLLGQKEDELAIQMLGIRLYSGLLASGGWTYTSGPDVGGGGGLPAIGGLGGLGGEGGGQGLGMIPGGRAMPPAGIPGAPGGLPGPGAGPIGPARIPSMPTGEPQPGAQLPGGPAQIPPGVGVPPPLGGGRGVPDRGGRPDNGFPQPRQGNNPRNPRGGQPDNGFPIPTPKQNPGGGANSDEAMTGQLLPAAVQYYRAVRNMLRGGRPGGDGDNSNTQFGLIGLWVASRHGVPATDAFALIEARFLTTQNRVNGGWAYTSADGNATPAMTCAGLLGLAVGAGKTAASATPKAAAPKPGSNNPFDNPKISGGDLPDARKGLEGARKVAVDAALLGLSQVVRAAAGGPAAVPGASAGRLNQYVGLGNEFYLLWSIERVAMAYGLDTLGDIDWHNWGADILIPMQGPDGGWQDSGHYGPDVNTSLAILFLSRSNFVKDLSAKIRGQVRDPGKSELRGSNVPALFAPKSEKGSAGEAGGEVGVVASEPKSDPIAEGLVNATGPAWADKLQQARDTKGGEHTAGLVRAIPLLDAARRKEARQALAERLTRMTAGTLRKMMNDPNPELRRGAVLACGMKDDLDHVVDLIDRITDSSDLVIRAARASLKSMVNQDFGPPTGATEEQKEQAKASWVKWVKENQAKP